MTYFRRWEKNDRDHVLRGLLDKVSEKGGQEVSLEIVSFMVWLRTLCGWGAKGIAAELAHQGIARISHQTVHRIFLRYHLPTKTYHTSGKSNGKSYRRYRKRAPNEMWHVDFAGPFQIVSQKVSLRVVVGDDSRFALAIEVTQALKTTTVTGILEGLFSQYGTQEEILTDNGTTFASTWTTGTHPFEVFCDSHDVSHQ
ncbi:transposase [Candidatus Poribacteria bacterium]|nr:transposase [Candidatus Poribacteria bacterium]